MENVPILSKNSRAKREAKRYAPTCGIRTAFMGIGIVVDPFGVGPLSRPLKSSCARTSAGHTAAGYIPTMTNGIFL